MANGFKNMTFAGADGAAVVAQSSARRPGMAHWLDYQVGQRPCGPISVGRGQALAAEAEGLCLADRRQLKT